MRMNPHGTTDRLRHTSGRPLSAGPSGSRSKATDRCDPRRSSGTTIRPPGPSCASQAGARSLTPTVAMIRSYGAPGGYPAAPSAATTVTSG